MRVLVTGGAGFIGSHFAKRLLAAGDDVRVLDKLTYSGNPANLDGTGIELVVGDICDPEAVAEAAAGCDAIVNFAAETHVDRSILGATDFGRTEFFGTQVLLEEVRRTGARFVQVSTDEVYGDLGGGGSAAETDPVKPSSPYSVAKAAGDLHIPAYARTFGVNASITRGSNTYGPNQYPEKLIPLMTTNAIEGQPLPVYGDGKQIRDWLWVEDHCAGIELVLREGAPGEVYNVGGDDERENVEIVGHILRLTGADESLIRHVEDRAGPRPPLFARHEQAARARLEAAEGVRGGDLRDGRVVPLQPQLVGADQVGRVPRVLREAVRARASPPASRLLVSPAAPLRFLPQPLDLLAVALHLRRAVEQLEDAVARAEREAGEGEVVARIRLGGLPGAGEPGDGLLEQRQGALVVARLHQREAAVVQLGRALGRRRGAVAGSVVGWVVGWAPSSPSRRPSVPSSVTVSLTVSCAVGVSSSPREQGGRDDAREQERSECGEQQREAASARLRLGDGRRQGCDRRRPRGAVERVAKRVHEVGARVEPVLGLLREPAREHVVHLGAAAPGCGRRRAGSERSTCAIASAVEDSRSNGRAPVSSSKATTASA